MGRWGSRDSEKSGARDAKRTDISLKEWEEASEEQKTKWRNEGSTLSSQASSELYQHQKKQGNWKGRFSSKFR